MSSPLRIFYSEPAPARPEEPETPAASSFAKTLRRFAEKQPSGPVNIPQLSVVPEPKTKRPRVMGTPLTMGGIAAPTEPQKEEPAAQPAEAAEEPKKQPQPLGGGLVSKAWSWLQKSKFSSTKQLRVAETISLGEKRFVALVDIEGQKFLIGGGASGVSLLTQLGAQDSAKEAIQAVEAAAGPSK